MTFDPFNDFATRGYLRNFEGEKDLAKIKLVEHASFLAKLDTALTNSRGSTGFPIKTFSTRTGRFSRTFIRGRGKTARRPRRIK